MERLYSSDHYNLEGIAMKVTIVGGGMMGLCTAMLLAGDDHDVVVLERDGAPPPDPLEAWDTWERKGVNQLRMAHFFLSRFRSLVETELPQLAVALTAAGACRYNVVHNIPNEMKGGARPGDDRFDVLTGRRATVEAVTGAHLRGDIECGGPPGCDGQGSHHRNPGTDGRASGDRSRA